MKSAVYIGLIVAALIMFSPKKATAKVNDLRGQLARHKSKKFNTRSIDEIKEITIHHSGVEGSNIFNHADYHVNIKDWPGVSYHYSIEDDGTINLLNDISNITYHDAGENVDSIGVMFEGNFDKRKPTPAALRSFGILHNKLTDYLERRLHVEGHSRNDSTSCPGSMFPLHELELKYNQDA